MAATGQPAKGEKARKPYKFHFNAEVARARAEYPGQTANTVFLDTGAPGAEVAVRAYLRRDTVMIEIRRGLESNKAEIKEMIRNAEAQKMPPEEISSRVYAIKKQLRSARRKFAANIRRRAREILSGRNFMQGGPSNPGHFLLGVDAQNTGGGLIDSAAPEKEKFFAFWHEVGHLVEMGEPPAKSPASAARRAVKKAKGENHADVFALLNGLRRGVLNKADAKKLAHNRVANTLVALDPEHLTAAAVGRAAKRGIKALRSQTPRQIAKAARAIAGRFPARFRDLQKIDKLGRKFHASCDEQAQAQFMAIVKGKAHKSGATTMDYLESAPGFCKDIAQAFSAFAAKAEKGSVERRYCESLVKTARAAARARPR